MRPPWLTSGFAALLVRPVLRGALELAWKVRGILLRDFAPLRRAENVELAVANDPTGRIALGGHAASHGARAVAAELRRVLFRIGREHVAMLGAREVVAALVKVVAVFGISLHGLAFREVRDGVVPLEDQAGRLALRPQRRRQEQRGRCEKEAIEDGFHLVILPGR